MYFAKLVTVGDQWGINFFRVTEDTSSKEQMFHVEQFCYPSGEQDTYSPDVVYVGGHLAFITGNRIQTVKLHEISDRLGELLLARDNWDRLGKGLQNKSESTVEWLKKKGLPVP